MESKDLWDSFEISRFDSKDSWGRGKKLESKDSERLIEIGRFVEHLRNSFEISKFDYKGLANS